MRYQFVPLDTNIDNEFSFDPWEEVDRSLDEADESDDSDED